MVARRQIRAGRDAFYRGFVAEALGEFSASQELMDTSGTPHRGLLTADDLARWEPTVEESTSVDYAGVTVHKTGPWGQGPVLLQQLQLLSGFDLPAMGLLSPDWVHTVDRVREARLRRPRGLVRRPAGRRRAGRRRCCRQDVRRRAGAPWSATPRRTTCAPAAPTGAPPGCGRHRPPRETGPR